MTDWEAAELIERVRRGRPASDRPPTHLEVDTAVVLAVSRSIGRRIVKANAPKTP
jgi:hypothetical protein